MDIKKIREQIKASGWAASLYRTVYVALILAGWSVQDAKAEARRAGYRVRIGSTIEKDAAAIVASALARRNAETLGLVACLLTPGYAIKRQTRKPGF